MNQGETVVTLRFREGVIVVEVGCERHVVTEAHFQHDERMIPVMDLRHPLVALERGHGYGEAERPQPMDLDDGA